jgi:glycosyltransferase involved in cell wall biosynthesis
MPNVLALTRYDRLGASSRVRFLQFRDVLAAHGVRTDVQPFFDDAYVSALYAGRSPGLTQILAFYRRRRRALQERRRYDLLWLEKEALPWLPFWLESGLTSGVPYVVDLDDAWFHRYDRNRIALVRSLMGNKIDRVMRGATIVVAGNDYLAARAREAGARRIEVIPTVIDLARYPPAQGATRDDGTLTVGWIGQPLNAHYLATIEPALRRIASRQRIKLRVVGAPVPPQWNGLPAESRPWSEATEIDEIGAFDVGIMPLPDTPWERGKCAYKLIQVMAAGKPVVASPVGANCEVVRHGANGYLAGTTEEWANALSQLATDRDTRRHMGEAARRTVEDAYSLDRVAPRLARVLSEAATLADASPLSPLAGRGSG